MLASITENAGIVTVIGSAQDDVVVVVNSSATVTDLSINAGQPDAVFASFNSLLIQEVLVYGGDGDDAVYNNSTASMKMFGQNGNDNLNGGSKFDLIYGNDGNDRLAGKGGNDRLIGGNGDDVLLGGSGNDFLGAGSGNDTLSGHGGDDHLAGNGGSDLLYGGAGVDTLFGGGESDYLYGHQGDDALWGHGGNDWLYGNEGRDSLIGGSGNDRLAGGNDSDVIDGQIGNDQLFGDGGNDRLVGGTGSDNLTGGAGDDVFYEDSGDFFIDISGNGRDEIRFYSTGSSSFSHTYGNGNIDIYATNASETIRVFADRVTINSQTMTLDIASAGLVRIFGLAGDDDIRVTGNAISVADYDLRGGAGDDTLYGGAGADILNGGAGNDIVFGEVGNDRYIFAGNFDLGNDFVSDKHGINTIDFSSLDIGVGVSFDLTTRVYQNVARNIADGRKLNIRLDEGINPAAN